MKENKLHRVSALGKTWLFDVDGTIVKHNGYKLDGHDTLLEGAKEFIDGLPAEDKVILITSRTEEYRDSTVAFLKAAEVRFDEIIFGLPMGERILINDEKPGGLKTSVAVNTRRDEFMTDRFIIDPDI